MNPVGPAMKREHLSSLWRRFCRNRDGAAAIEFVIIAPVLIAAYVGMINIAQMATISRKTTQLTSTLSDLTARLQSVSKADIDNIFNAAKTVLLPYDSAEAEMLIASIVIDADRVARVCWANVYPTGRAAPARGSAITVPDSFRVANTSVIMARASYSFTPTISQAVFDGYVFKDVTLGGNAIYSRPRFGRPDGDAQIEQLVRSDVKGCPKFT